MLKVSVLTYKLLKNLVPNLFPSHLHLLCNIEYRPHKWGCIALRKWSVLPVSYDINSWIIYKTQNDHLPLVHAKLNESYMRLIQNSHRARWGTRELIPRAIHDLYSSHCIYWTLPVNETIYLCSMAKKLSTRNSTPCFVQQDGNTTSL